jgi:O-succinylbenzoate synthase
MGTALAAALPDHDYDCGLGTSALFTSDVCDPALSPRGGELRVGRVSPSAERLDALQVSPERDGWWRERLSRCHAILSASDR